METLPGVAPQEQQNTYFYVGQHETKRTVPVTTELGNQAQDAGYDMMTRPITSPGFQARVLALVDAYFDAVSSSSNADAVPYPLVAPLTPEDTNLVPDEYISTMICCTSPWIDLASPDPVIAHVSRQVFNHEVAYAAFCGVNNIMIQGPGLEASSVISQYARAIWHSLEVGPYINLQVLLPMQPREDSAAQNGLSLAGRARDSFKTLQSISTDALWSWDTWELIRSTCKYHPRLTVALEVPQKLPSSAIQSRWFSEPLRTLIIPESTFMKNAKGFPVLSKHVQSLLTRYMRLKTVPWIILSDVGPIPGQDHPGMPVNLPDRSASPELPTPAQSKRKQQVQKPKDLTPYLSYIRHLQRTQPPRPIIDRFAAGYQDFLQSPLQPLTDNLESITYEVFEKDPIKYEWYERAVAAALKDLHKKLQRPVVVAVVGSGRGPLVTRCLKASASTGIPVTQWAIEKNPNAYVLLQRRNATDPLWNKRVTVVKTDMRAWAGPIIDGQPGKVDILVSELLGSFADNELSPECLDGVQHVLHPEHGVSVPTSYTAHFTPIAHPRIYADLLSRTDDQKWELPYVTMLHQYDNLCLQPLDSKITTGDKTADNQIPDIQTAWEFVHPLPTPIIAQSTLRRGGSVQAGGSGMIGGDGWNEHNSRFCHLRFTASSRGVCHGLGGYFETVLYSPADGSKKIELSINPNTMEDKSKDMISWFPIFFPLKTPLYIPTASEIEVSMWRQTDDRKVWYEWQVEVFVTLPGGNRQRIAASELHSSIKNGCLM
ncbi:Skb1 methyltransferase [Aureobasidium pullulans]|uniref:Protein arginine N-methyltransferase n=1 Tax=Aureobasidium pullulans TaxID=5580 RepID=A0A4S9ZL68_AURPU|nr:Skb1 methyltransferase [Aureobasidium pullulans]THX04000.1 Skb1 methyltransferase [Aureobasidium pullulans]THZ19218.1 Skb1 methyltransferase [Aureobasidium pullulans]THZ57720.1 Skb1 methyltransferase [Aureobasidium pullulans]TIA05465.1 Skb1 methyltransferase [Aureobasidium pullulans]